MLCPFGDAKTTGRIIDDSFERSLTLKFAEELEKIIESQNKKRVEVVLNRTPGEILEPLQNANFANRLDVDFFLSIHFFKENGARPKAYLFSYTNDIYPTSLKQDLSFVSFDEAFRINLNKTKKYAELFANSLNQEKNKYNFDFKNHLNIPYKPLSGIKTPALAFEASLKNSADWKQYLEPVCEALNSLIQKTYE